MIFWKDDSAGGEIEVLPKSDRTDHPIVTQAKYFHYVESDSVKVMVGFQTYEELLASLEPDKYMPPTAAVPFPKHCKHCGAEIGYY